MVKSEKGSEKEKEKKLTKRVTQNVSLLRQQEKEKGVRDESTAKKEERQTEEGISNLHRPAN